MISLVSHFSFTKQVGQEQELERKGKKRPSRLTYQFWFGFPICFPSQSDAKSLSSVSLTQLLVSKVVKQWSLGGAVGLHSAHTRSTTSCYCNIHNIFLGFPWCAWTMVMNGRWYAGMKIKQIGLQNLHMHSHFRTCDGCQIVQWVGSNASKTNLATDQMDTDITINVVKSWIYHRTPI